MNSCLFLLLWKMHGYTLKRSSNSKDSYKTLQNNFLEPAALNNGFDWDFQRGYTSILSSQITRAWCNDNSFKVIKLSARISELNSTDNLCCVLTSGAYCLGKQYSETEFINTVIKMNGSKIINLFYRTWSAQCKSDA